VDGSFGSLPACELDVIGVVVVVAGVALLVGGWLLLRTNGASWRVGRLLAAAPQRSISEARAMAARGEPAYVQVHGRIDSAEEFPGDEAQPLVFRRRRLQYRPGGLRTALAGPAGWRTFSDERLAVPFGLSERGERVALDVESLGDGLVVVPRVSEGRAAELPPPAEDEHRPTLSPETEVRLRIDQVATTDHGTACGVLRLLSTGEAALGPGLGRPLVLTNLDPDEAMRVLGAGQRGRLLGAACLLAVGPVTIAVGLLLLLSATAVGADPTPGPVGLIAGDPRSEGVGPGLVGSPLGVLVAVVALGVATAVITAVLARLLQRR
jgi:hypothetical protein